MGRDAGFEKSDSLLVLSLIHLFLPSFVFRESICGTHGTASACSQALAPVPSQRQKPARLPSFTSVCFILLHWCPSLIRCSSCKHLTSNPSAQPHSGGSELTFHGKLTPQWCRLLPAFMSGPPSRDFALARAWEYLLSSVFLTERADKSED